MVRATGRGRRGTSRGTAPVRCGIGLFRFNDPWPRFGALASRLGGGGLANPNRSGALAHLAAENFADHRQGE